MDKVEMKGEYNQFIGEYSGACNSKFTDSIITAFDYYTSMGATYCEDQQFENSNAGRFDYAIDLMDMNPSMKDHPLETLNGTLQECFNEYVRVFGHLRTVPMYSCVQKVQMTPAGGGYHVWHDENSHLEHANKKRVQPEKGKLLIWPAGMTHAHRGGLVLKGTKYIVTGWFYLANVNGRA